MSRFHRKRLMSEINVVPYIDVMLVLLVIFMITAPLLTEGVRIDLVKADARPIDSPQQLPFIVHVDKQGAFFLNENTQPASELEVRTRAAAVLKHRPQTDFLVRGDGDAVYQAVVRAMVALQQAGVANVGLITSPEKDG